MKMVRRVYDGKDCRFGPDPASIISIVRLVEKWVLEKSVMLERLRKNIGKRKLQK